MTLSQQSGFIFDDFIAAHFNDFLSAASTDITERYNAGGGMGSFGGAQNNAAAAVRKMKTKALPKIKPFSSREELAQASIANSGQGKSKRIGYRDSMKTRKMAVLKDAKRELSQLARSQSVDSLLPSSLLPSLDRSSRVESGRRGSGTLTPPSLLAASSAPTLSPRCMKQRSSMSEIETSVLHDAVGAGIPAHDRDNTGRGNGNAGDHTGNSRSRTRAWSGSTAASGVEKKDTHTWHSVVDGVLMSILHPPSDFQALEKAREPKETNIVGKRTKRVRSPRKISFHVGASVELGPVSFVKTFEKDDTIDAKLRCIPWYAKTASERHGHGLNYNVRFQQSRLHADLEAGKDAEGDGGNSGRGGGGRRGSSTSITLPSRSSTTAVGGGGGSSASSIRSIRVESSGSNSNSNIIRSKKDGNKAAERKSLLGIAVPKRSVRLIGRGFNSGAKHRLTTTPRGRL